MSLTDLRTRPKATVSHGTVALVVACAVLLVHSAVALVVGANGWDDGSITVAFARTLAESGRIALTAPSEVVEGFSSPFWMLLLSATYAVLPLSFGGMLLASQLWSAFFSAVGSVLLYTVLRPALGTSAPWLSAGIFVSAVFLNETANGMEMSALSATTLAIVCLIRRRNSSWPALFALAALVPWIRFEAAGYVIAGAAVLAIASRDRSRSAALIGGVLASLAVLTALRWSIFDAIIPNTLAAKQSPPYPHGESFGEQIAMSKTVIKESLYVIAPGLIVAVAALVARPLPRPRFDTFASVLKSGNVSGVLAFSAGFLAAVVGANVAIGPNWGYLGRMEQTLVPLTVVIAVYCLPRHMRSLRNPLRLGLVMAALVALTVYGIDRDRVAESLEPGSGDGITPSAYRETGRAIDVVRRDLGQETLSVLIPDVGGASLCCERLQILDLGLLANRTLARDGYAATGSYLAEQKPDMVVTHSVWSDASGIYGLKFFRDNYSPVAVHRMWLYLRNDLYARLAGRCRALPLESSASYRYRGDATDEKFITTLGSRSICELD